MGFVAKVAVFRAAVGAGYWPLVLIGVLASVVAAYFYLRVIVLMFMHEPQEAEAEQDDDPAPRRGRRAAALVLVLGVFRASSWASSTRRRCSMVSRRGAGRMPVGSVR